MVYDAKWMHAKGHQVHGNHTADFSTPHGEKFQSQKHKTHKSKNPNYAVRNALPPQSHNYVANKSV